MSSSANPTVDHLQIGDWTVEPSTGFLRCDGRKERLEPRVMSVLCLLASEAGRVFSKQELFDQVWGVAVVEDVTLSRCISDLRRALGDDARNPLYIETIPKKGYRLIVGVARESATPEPEVSPSETERGRRMMAGAAVAVLAVLGLVFWMVAGREELDESGSFPLSAYDYYLQGREHYKKYRRAENEQAIELYRLAIEADPSFALGHAELANSLALQEGNFGVPGDWSRQAMVSAATALELQPDLAEAHKAMAHALTVQERYVEAANYFRQALEIRPDYREAVSGLGLMLYLQGDFVDGLAQFQKAHTLGFENSITAQHVGWIYWRLGLYDVAENWFRRALEFEPHHTGARKGLAWVDLSRGEIESARQKIGLVLDVHPECDTCLALAGDIELASGDMEAARSYFWRASEIRDGNYLYGALRLGQVLALMGEEGAEVILEDAARSAERYMDAGSEDVLLPWTIAASEALRGNREPALVQIERAWQAGHRRWDLDDSAFEALRTIPRYQLLLQRNRHSLLKDRARLQDSVVEAQ